MKSLRSIIVACTLGLLCVFGAVGATTAHAAAQESSTTFASCKADRFAAAINDGGTVKCLSVGDGIGAKQLLEACSFTATLVIITETGILTATEISPNQCILPSHPALATITVL